MYDLKLNVIESYKNDEASISYNRTKYFRLPIEGFLTYKYFRSIGLSYGTKMSYKNGGKTIWEKEMESGWRTINAPIIIDSKIYTICGFPRHLPKAYYLYEHDLLNGKEVSKNLIKVDGLHSVRLSDVKKEFDSDNFISFGLYGKRRVNGSIKSYGITTVIMDASGDIIKQNYLSFDDQIIPEIESLKKRKHANSTVIEVFKTSEGKYVIVGQLYDIQSSEYSVNKKYFEIFHATLNKNLELESIETIPIVNAGKVKYETAITAFRKMANPKQEIENFPTLTHT